MNRALAAIGAIAIVLVALGGCSDTRARKPVLYLYPERVVSLGVGLSYDGVVSDSYPVAVGGVGADGRALASWSVTAGPDGVLRDGGGRAYPYLFWEGPTRADLSQGSGFVVARDDVVGFLEEKLALLGLDEREAADFITYWAPRIRAYDYTFVSFDASAYTQHASYSFTDEAGATVTPDTFIRVFMTIREADANTVVQPQTLAPSPTRSGFTVVEWGGTEQQKSHR